MSNDNEFICANCGNPLTLCMVTYFDSFDKLTLKACEEKDDFNDLYMSNYTTLHVECDTCGDPKFTQEDLDWLAQYQDPTQIEYERR